MVVYATRSVAPAVTVSALGFGTWQWGNRLLWDYKTQDDQNLAIAYDAATKGPHRTLFDTGDSYGTGAELEGRAETLLGDFRAASPAPDAAVFATKLAVYPTRLTGASFEAACRASLRRMRRDKIELVQAHWSAQRWQPWQEPALWDGLARCYEAGLAQAVGTSNFGPEQLLKVNRYWSDRGVPHGVNQVQLSLLSTLPIESGLLDACAELGVTPIGYSPLALGVLSGKYDEENLPSGPRGLIFKALLPSCKPLLDTLRAIADEREVSMSSVAINWSLGKGALVIVGLRSAEQAAENKEALGWSLSEGEVHALETAAKTAKRATQNIFQTN